MKNAHPFSDSYLFNRFSKMYFPVTSQNAMHWVALTRNINNIYYMVVCGCHVNKEHDYRSYEFLFFGDFVIIVLVNLLITDRLFLIVLDVVHSRLQHLSTRLVIEQPGRNIEGEGKKGSTSKRGGLAELTNT